MKRFLLGCSLAAIVSATPALAADLGGSLKDGGYEYGGGLANWSGWYIGVHGGYGWGSMDATRSVTSKGAGFTQSHCDYTVDDSDKEAEGLTKEACEALKGSYDAPADAPDASTFTDARYYDPTHVGSESFSSVHPLEMNGFFGGIDLSRKFKAGHLIIEPFVDASFGGGKGSVSDSRDITVYTDSDGNNQTLSGITAKEDFNFSVKKRWGATAGMKIGVLASGSDEIYGLGGLAYGNFKIKSASNIGVSGGAGDMAVGNSFDENSSEWGYTLGLGWEHAISNNWHFGLEGRYTAFDNIGASGSASKEFLSGTANNGVTVDRNESIAGDYDEWSVRARLTYRFGN